MNGNNNQQQEEELEEIEDRLIKEAEEKEEKKIKISGKSVFELQNLITRKRAKETRKSPEK